MSYPQKIDLHMHSNISDGTDSPTEIISNVKAAGIELFSLTDHDAVKGCTQITKELEGDIKFITGAEFSCKDEHGQYHILGYNYDATAKAINETVDEGHRLRMEKLEKRLDFLNSAFGFAFSDEDKSGLFSLDNPGKPHIGNLMVKYGYAESKEDAIENYINKFHAGSKYVKPDTAIEAIIRSGGIPVLAHPSYGKGDELILGNNMDNRLRRLMDFGLRGVEAFYSGFSPKIIKEMLSFAKRYDLLITAGSDYHGKNKMVKLGDTNLPAAEDYPEGLKRFIITVTNEN